MKSVFWITTLTLYLFFSLQNEINVRFHYPLINFNNTKVNIDKINIPMQKLFKIYYLFHS